MYFEEEINTHIEIREGDNESNLIDCQQVTIAISTMCIHKMHIVQEFSEVSIKGGVACHFTRNLKAKEF